MAEKKRRRTRIPKSSITELPEELQRQLDQKLAENRLSFVALSEWLNGLGYPISKSAIGRYTVHANRAAERVADTLAKTQAIVRAVEGNPDLDYTKASRIVMMDGLLQKVSTADEEFLEMPLDKAGRLIASLSRAEIYSQKAKHDFKTKIELAFEGMEADLMAAIKNDPVIAPKLHSVLVEARDRLVKDE